MALVEMNFAEGGGNLEINYNCGLMNGINGGYIITCNGKKLNPNGESFYTTTNYSDEYLTVTSPASSYVYTYTPTKNCKQINYVDGTTTDRPANTAFNITATDVAVFLEF